VDRVQYSRDLSKGVGLRAHGICPLGSTKLAKKSGVGI